MKMLSLKKVIQFRRTGRARGGSVILEFSMLVPIMLALSYGAIEFGRALGSREKMSNLSSEAGRQSFNQCIDKTDLNACLAPLAVKMDEYSQVVLPGATVVLSMYRMSTGGVITRDGFQCIDPATHLPPVSPSVCPSRLTATDVLHKFGSGSNAAISPTNRVLAIGEVFFQHSRITPSIPWVSRFTIGSLYEATIY